MITKLKMPIILVAIFATGLFAQQRKETLNDLIKTAIEVSPKIKMLKNKLKLADARIAIGTNLPDPKLKLGLGNLPVNSFSFTQEPMTGKIIGLSQAIPFPGALSAKAAVKSVDTSIVRQELEDAKNQIRQSVSDIYFQLEFIRTQIRLTRESIDLLNQINRVVKRKYEVNSGSLQNIIRTELQISKMNDKLEDLKGKAGSLQAQLNALLLRDSNAPVYASGINRTLNLKLSVQKLIREAVLNRPNLKKIKLLTKKAELLGKKAEYAFYPNFNIGVQYSQRDYLSATGKDLTDFFSVVLGVSLPINYGGKKTAELNEAKFLQSVFEDQYGASLQVLSKMFGNLTAKLEALSEREKLIENSLLPQAEKSYQAALADYQVGKIDFVNVIRAEDEILRVKTELAKVRANYYRNIAQVEFLAGVKIINNVN